MRDYSFQSHHRIKKRSQFQHLGRVGKKIHSKNFLIILSENDSGSARIGITITKKISKKAVVRNKLRRRIREIFRLFREDLVKHFDIVVIARQNADILGFDEIERQIRGALRYHRYLSGEDNVSKG